MVPLQEVIFWNRPFTHGSNYRNCQEEKTTQERLHERFSFSLVARNSKTFLLSFKILISAVLFLYLQMCIYDPLVGIIIIIFFFFFNLEEEVNERKHVWHCVAVVIQTKALV